MEHEFGPVPASGYVPAVRVGFGCVPAQSCCSPSLLAYGLVADNRVRMATAVCGFAFIVAPWTWPSQRTGDGPRPGSP
jgi:hypothetical protein